MDREEARALLEDYRRGWEKTFPTLEEALRTLLESEERAQANYATVYADCERFEAMFMKAEQERDRLKEENERLTVQLAGCSVAAFGGTKDPAKRDDYGWSPAYQDVLDLRLRVEAALAPLEGSDPPVYGLVVKALKGGEWWQRERRQRDR